MRHAHWTALVFTASAFAARLEAGVIVVDDGGGAGVDFTSLAAAALTAGDGDLVLVKSGSYSGFTVSGKALQIHADLGAVVTLGGGVLVQNLPAGKTVVLRGLDVPQHLSGQPEAIKIMSCAGQVRVEDCSFQGMMELEAFPAAVVKDSPAVAFLRCSLAGGSVSLTSPFAGAPGLVVAPSLVASNVTLHDCSCSGGFGTGTLGGNGGDGAIVSGGTCSSSGSTFSGGAGGSGAPGSFGGPGKPGGNGGAGIRVQGNGVVRSVGDSFAGGAGGSGGDGQPLGAPGQSGAAQAVISGSLITHPGPARHYSVTSPVREGGSATHSFQGLAFESVFLMLSPTHQYAWNGAWHGTMLLGFPILFVPLGAADAGGQFTFTGALPELGPGIDGLGLAFQSLFAGTAAGPHFGPASLQLLLDASY